MLTYSRWQTAVVLGVAAFFCLAAVPNVLPARALAALPAWASRTVPLGYDLQGGMRLQLAVDTGQARRMYLEALRDDVRRVLRDDRVQYTGLMTCNDGVEVRIREGADLPRAITALNSWVVRPFQAQSADDATRPPISKPLDARPSVRPTPGAENAPPEYAMDVADGMIRLTIPDAAFRARIISERDKQADVFSRRLDGYPGITYTLQKIGDDRFVVESPVNFERLLYLVH